MNVSASLEEHNFQADVVWHQILQQRHWTARLTELAPEGQQWVMGGCFFHTQRHSPFRLSNSQTQLIFIKSCNLGPVPQKSLPLLSALLIFLRAFFSQICCCFWKASYCRACREHAPSVARWKRPATDSCCQVHKQNRLKMEKNGFAKSF